MKILTILLASIVALSACGQEFDEEFDHWPVKLKLPGTIILYNKLENPKILAEAFRRYSPSKPDSNKDVKPNALVISSKETKLEEIREFANADWVSSKSQTVTLDGLDIGKLKPQLAETDLLILHWPISVEPSSDQLQELGSTIETFLAANKTLMANGAASKWLSKHVLRGNSSLKIEPGMNVLFDTTIVTKFQTDQDQRRLYSALAQHPRSVGIGIANNTCIIMRGRKLSVFETGAATFCLDANAREPRMLHTITSDARPKNRYDFEFNLVDLTQWRRVAIDRTLPVFPPKKPNEPSVDNGTLVIVGGGGMPKNLMKDLVEMAGGSKARMVYVPCAEQDEISKRQRTVEYWKSLGVESATYIHTKDRNKANSDEEFLKPLRNATGIWFGGGRQWNFSDSYFGTKAHKLMKDVLKRGGVIGGSSAGASIQARYLARATPIANYKIMAPGYERGGLGFISGVAIDQHFSQRGRQKDMTQLVNRYPQLLGIGIDEATALIVQKNKARIVGRGKVHFYDRNQPVYPDRPDFVALPKGSEYDLVARKVLVDGNNQQEKAEPETKDNESSSGKEDKTTPVKKS